MYCSYCGKEVNENQKHCVYCGTENEHYVENKNEEVITNTELQKHCSRKQRQCIIGLCNISINLWCFRGWLGLLLELLDLRTIQILTNEPCAISVSVFGRYG